MLANLSVPGSGNKDESENIFPRVDPHECSYNGNLTISYPIYITRQVHKSVNDGCIGGGPT